MKVWFEQTNKIRTKYQNIEVQISTQKQEGNKSDNSINISKGEAFF